MRLLVTGSRSWRNYSGIYRVFADLDLPEDTVVVHGAATGADHMARSAALAHGLTEEPHFPEYHKYSVRDAPKFRNMAMVEAGADLCLAFPTPESQGTYHCAKLADKAGIEVRWFVEEDV